MIEFRRTVEQRAAIDQLRNWPRNDCGPEILRKKVRAEVGTRVMRKLPKQSTDGNKSLLEHALAYRDRGFCVIPTARKKAVCSWKGYQTASPDEPTIRRLFSRSDIDGIAVLLGSASNGLCCRDYDDMTTYNLWAESHPQLALALPTVETRRGRHLYFCGPSIFQKLADGELRGTAGHYTVLPPSLHPSGRIYRWLVPLPKGDLPTIDPFEVGLCNEVDRVNGVDRAETSLLSLLPLSTPSTPLQAVEQAINATLPTATGQRNRCIFRFARYLKSIQGLGNANASILRQFVEQWHQRALPIIGTKPFIDSWADFLQAWERIRVPAGQGVIDMAFQRAVASQQTEYATNLYGEGPIALLVVLCRELQQIAGDGEFFLDCRTAGRLIGVDHTTAWRYLAVLCADGVLKPGRKGSKASQKASRFRFIEAE